MARQVKTDCFRSPVLGWVRGGQVSGIAGAGLQMMAKGISHSVTSPFKSSAFPFSL